MLAATGCVPILLLLRGGLVFGQLSEASPEPVRDAPTGYRDGGEWVAVERSGPVQGGFSPVHCQRGTRHFDAHVTREAIVQLDAARGDVERLFGELGIRPLARLSARARIYKVESRSGEDGLELAARLAHAPGLASATPDLYLPHHSRAFAIPPNDEHYRGQWYFDLLEIEAAWRISSGDPEVKVAVIDTGCDLQHPDLQGAFVDGLDLVDSDTEPQYQPGAKGNEHGTACAGIIGARGNNSIGVVGVCPECSLVCIRLFQEHNTLVPLSADIAAFDHALEAGAAVVSNSWGFAKPTPVPAPLREVIRMLMSEGRGGLGSVVVFAAGNENRELGRDEIGAIPGVINVGATTNFDEAAPFSNYGPSIDLTAPTASFTTDISGPDGDTAGDYTMLFGGTSSACPVVAGVAALMLSADKTATGAHVTDLLAATTRPALYAQPDSLGHDPLYGYGMLAPAPALRALLGLPEPVPEPNASPMEREGREAGADAGCRALGAQHGSPFLGLWGMSALAGALLWRRRG